MSAHEQRSADLERREVCPECGAAELNTRVENESFKYGSGSNTVELEATVPVTVCQSCGYSFFPPEAEEAKHDAVCKHVGVMTPKEIVAIRRDLELTRAEFAELTRLGEATIGRWERGAVVQNAANDQYLFLLSIPENLKELRKRQRRAEGDDSRREATISLKFPTLDNVETVAQEAQQFQLRTG